MAKRRTAKKGKLEMLVRASEVLEFLTDDGDVIKSREMGERWVSADRNLEGFYQLGLDGPVVKFYPLPGKTQYRRV